MVGMQRGEVATTAQKPEKEKDSAWRVPPNDGGIAGFFKRELHLLRRDVHDARQTAIYWTPRHIVNNSSNGFGFAHVLTEMAMFKASSKDPRLIRNREHWYHYITEPFKTVYVETFKNTQTKEGVNFEFFKGNPLKNVWTYVTDMEKATEREISRLENKGAKIGFPNRFQTLSTLAGLVTWSLSALIPEKKDDDAEIERMEIKKKDRPFSYVAERLKQTVWFPDWAYNKRQMIGLGMATSGVFSTIGAWRGRETCQYTKAARYAFNRGYLMTSLLTLASSIPLIFASDERRAFGSFGTIMMGRIPFLFDSIGRKYKMSEPGRHWYLGSSFSFQAENLGQALIGGAEKLPDGTIVDHEEARRNAAKKYEEMKMRKRELGLTEQDQTPGTPTMVVSQIESTQPMREAALQAK
jgi:hypothetical protein